MRMHRMIALPEPIQIVILRNRSQVVQDVKACDTDAPDGSHVSCVIPLSSLPSTICAMPRDPGTGLHDKTSQNNSNKSAPKNAGGNVLPNLFG